MFNEDESGTGRYYMKRDSDYLQALPIYLEDSEIQEVESILKTITAK